MAELRVLETSSKKLQAKVEESIDRVLAEVQALREAGELTGIVVLMTTTNEDTYSCWSKQSDNHMMLAALTRAMVRMAKN
jgi:hypothetical protein